MDGAFFALGVDWLLHGNTGGSRRSGLTIALHFVELATVDHARWDDHHGAHHPLRPDKPLKLGVSIGGAVLLVLSFMTAHITHGVGRASLLVVP